MYNILHRQSNWIQQRHKSDEILMCFEQLVYMDGIEDPTSWLCTVIFVDRNVMHPCIYNVHILCWCACTLSTMIIHCIPIFHSKQSSEET